VARSPYTLDLGHGHQGWRRAAVDDGRAKQSARDAHTGDPAQKNRMSETAERQLLEKIDTLNSQKSQTEEQIKVQQGLVTKVTNDYNQSGQLSARQRSIWPIGSYRSGRQWSMAGLDPAWRGATEPP
jgi:hypothetical protein